MEAKLERIARDRRGLWTSGVIMLLALIGFVLLASFVGPRLPASLEGTPLIAVGVVLSVVPALLWLVFFGSSSNFVESSKGNRSASETSLL